MPFKSKAQAGYLWATHPKVARKFAHDSGLHHGKTSKAALKKFRSLPDKVKKRGKRKRKRG